MATLAQGMCRWCIMEWSDKEIFHTLVVRLAPRIVGWGYTSLRACAIFAIRASGSISEAAARDAAGARRLFAEVACPCRRECRCTVTDRYQESATSHAARARFGFV